MWKALFRPWHSGPQYKSNVEAGNWSHLFRVIKLMSQFISAVMIYWYLKDNTSVIYFSLPTWSKPTSGFACLELLCSSAGLTSQSSQPPIVFKDPLMGTVFMFSIMVCGYILLLAAMKCQNKNLRQSGKFRRRRALISSRSVPAEWSCFQYKWNDFGFMELQSHVW